MVFVSRQQSRLNPYAYTHKKQGRADSRPGGALVFGKSTTTVHVGIVNDGRAVRCLYGHMLSSVHNYGVCRFVVEYNDRAD